jgi:GR25 family glycosyltransferase involved in LPS biosynthesis
MNLGIYAINLNSRPDRWKSLINQSNNIKLDIIRVPAIAKQDLENHFDSPPAVAACWLSHKLAMQEFLKSDYTHALILEDDAVFLKQYIETIRLIKENSSDLNKYEIIQLGYLKNKLGLLDSGTSDVFQKLQIKYFPKFSKAGNIFQVSKLKFLENSLEAGAHGYIVNRDGAEKLTRLNLKAEMATDLLFIKISDCKKMKTARLVGSVIAQSGSASSIDLRSKEINFNTKALEKKDPLNTKLSETKLEEIKKKYKVNYKILNSEFALLSTKENIDLLHYEKIEVGENMFGFDFIQIYYDYPTIFSQTYFKLLNVTLRYWIKLNIFRVINQFDRYISIRNSNLSDRIKQTQYRKRIVSKLKVDLKIKTDLIQNDFVPTKSAVLVSHEFLANICKYDSLDIFDLNNLFHGFSRSGNYVNFRVMKNATK